MAVVFIASALVMFFAVVGVDPEKSWQAFAGVGARRIHAASTLLAVVAVKSSLFQAFVNVLTGPAIPLVASVALAGILGLEVDAGCIHVTIVAPTTVVNAWTKHAAFPWHAEPLRFGACQRWACLLVNPTACHLSVAAVALHTLLCHLLSVVIENLFQKTALEAAGAAFSWLENGVLAGWRGAADWPALHFSLSTGANITVLLPNRAIGPDRTVDSAALLAFALFNRSYPLFSLD